MWKQGDRVKLVRCNDHYTWLNPGLEGIITFIDDFGTIHVDWDNGHKLGIIEEAGDEIVPVGAVDFSSICKYCNEDIKDAGIGTLACAWVHARNGSLICFMNTCGFAAGDQFLYLATPAESGSDAAN